MKPTRTGKLTRVQGWHTKRVHSFSTAIEYHFFLLLEWDDTTVDIEERHLLPPQSIQEIRTILQLPTNAAEITASDFLVTSKQGKEAWAVMPAKQLESRKALEDIDIRRIFWERAGIPFAVCTEKEINQTIVKNVQWVHGNREIDITNNELSSTKPVLENALMHTSLGEACRGCDDMLGLDNGTSLRIARHFIATKVWSVDVTNPISAQEKLHII